MSRLAVVLTTINLPTVLEVYHQNARHYGHDDIFYVVVGDRKSPPATGEYLQSLRRQGLEIVDLGVPEQQAWLKDYPALDGLLPYDSVQRRNLGYLVAAQRGAEVLISIDDDNIPLPEYDYFGEHGVVLRRWNGPCVASSSGWFNSCSLLETARPVYHRGYPVSRRWVDETLTYHELEAEVWVNAGLWLEDPDVDTVTRLEQPLEVTAVTHPRQRLLLESGLHAPFNSQNTAFHVRLLPAMFLITLRHSHQAILRQNNNFRYDDIWMSYFLKKVVDHCGGAVAIGPPHVRQVRNPHDLMLDLEKEVFPMRLTNRFPQLLPSLALSACGIFDSYAELADQLPGRAAECGYSPEELAVFEDTSEGMKIWLEAVRACQA